jgi:hypothetical protein
MDFQQASAEIMRKIGGDRKNIVVSKYVHRGNVLKNRYKKLLLEGL